MGFYREVHQSKKVWSLPNQFSKKLQQKNITILLRRSWLLGCQKFKLKLINLQKKRRIKEFLRMNKKKLILLTLNSKLKFHTTIKILNDRKKTLIKIHANINNIELHNNLC